MDQHEESVYKVAWSPADAWIYCSLSYDGRYGYLCLTFIIILFSTSFAFLLLDNVLTFVFCLLYRVIVNHVPSTEKYKILL